MNKSDKVCGNRRYSHPHGHPAYVGHTSLGTCVAVLMVATVATHAFAQAPSFPPIRHGIKAVFGQNGNDHGGDLKNAGQVMAKAFHDLGADLTRIEFKWAIVEENRGQYDWTETDRLIHFLHENGIEPMLMLYCAPKWAMRGTPADEQLFIERRQQNLYTVVWPRRDCLRDFERFCETAARRYRGKVKLFEFWNEPDGMAGPVVLHDKDGKAIDVRYGGDAKEYTYWLKRMYASVRRGNPDAVVAAGSLCVHDLNFIEAMYAAGCANHCDAISLHPYSGDGINVEWTRQVRAIMCQYGDWDKPIWLSEFGWNKGGNYNEKTKTWSKSAHEHAEIIKKTAPVIESIPYITQAYWFTLNDWNTSETGIDPTGTHGYGLMTLDLKRRPAFEAFRKVVARSPDKTRVGPTVQPTMVPPPGPVDIVDHRLRFNVKRFLPCQHDQHQPVESIVFKADGLFDKFSLKTEFAFSSFLGTKEEKARWTFVKPHPIRITHPLDPDRPITARTHEMQFGYKPTQVVSFLVTVPAEAPLQSPPIRIDADLADWTDRQAVRVDTMEIRFGWDRSRLYFACRIADDSHEQSYRGADIWKGDCVQLAIDPNRDAIRGSRYDDNDSEFAIALTEDGPAIWRYKCPVNSYGGAMPTEWISVKRKGNETTYEAAIPWIDIGVENPHTDQIIGAAVAGCDWNSCKRTVHRFGDGVIGGKEPYRFASIQLKGQRE